MNRVYKLTMNDTVLYFNASTVSDVESSSNKIITELAGAGYFQNLRDAMRTIKEELATPTIQCTHCSSKLPMSDSDIKNVQAELEEVQALLRAASAADETPSRAPLFISLMIDSPYVHSYSLEVIEVS